MYIYVTHEYYFFLIVCMHFKSSMPHTIRSVTFFSLSVVRLMQSVVNPSCEFGMTADY